MTHPAVLFTSDHNVNSNKITSQNNPVTNVPNNNIPIMNSFSLYQSAIFHDF